MLEVSVTNRDKTKVAADKITPWIAIEFISNDTLKLAVNFTDPETISIPVSYFIFLQKKLCSNQSTYQ
jgi:hypothetical protein